MVGRIIGKLAADEENANIQSAAEPYPYAAAAATIDLLYVRTRPRTSIIWGRRIFRKKSGAFAVTVRCTIVAIRGAECVMRSRSDLSQRRRRLVKDCFSNWQITVSFSRTDYERTRWDFIGANQLRYEI